MSPNDKPESCCAGGNGGSLERDRLDISGEVILKDRPYAANVDIQIIRPGTSAQVAWCDSPANAFICARARIYSTITPTQVHFAFYNGNPFCTNYASYSMVDSQAATSVGSNIWAVDMFRLSGVTYGSSTSSALTLIVFALVNGQWYCSSMQFYCVWSGNTSSSPQKTDCASFANPAAVCSTYGSKLLLKTIEKSTVAESMAPAWLLYIDGMRGEGVSCLNGEWRLVRDDDSSTEQAVVYKGSVDCNTHLKLLVRPQPGTAEVHIGSGKERIEYAGDYKVFTAVEGEPQVNGMTLDMRGAAAHYRNAGQTIVGSVHLESCS